MEKHCGVMNKGSGNLIYTFKQSFWLLFGEKMVLRQGENQSSLVEVFQETQARHDSHWDPKELLAEVWDVHFRASTRFTDTQHEVWAKEKSQRWLQRFWLAQVENMGISSTQKMGWRRLVVGEIWSSLLDTLRWKCLQSIQVNRSNRESDKKCSGWKCGWHVNSGCVNTEIVFKTMTGLDFQRGEDIEGEQGLSPWVTWNKRPRRCIRSSKEDCKVGKKPGDWSALEAKRKSQLTTSHTASFPANEKALTTW